MAVEMLDMLSEMRGTTISIVVILATPDMPTERLVTLAACKSANRSIYRLATNITNAKTLYRGNNPGLQIEGSVE